LTVTVHSDDAPDGLAEPIAIDAHQTAIGVAFVYQADGRQVRAAVTPLADGQTLVQWPGKDVVVRSPGRTAADISGDRSHSGDTNVCAPMPGRVVRVLVAAGDVVVARQGLIVMEAMKMENELASPRSGRVREVAVSAGISVESGRLLVVIE
jgi:biotin carboxyl carrier protein